MTASTLWPYRSPSSHEIVSAIIQRRSTNRTDIRDVALGDLDLTFAQNILDLGCGFGFMAEALARRVAPDARFVGVDAWDSNEAAFMEKVAANGRTAEFACLDVESTLPFPDQSFEVVVCSYSLYFFVNVLPEVARVLAPHGVFLTITHSERHIIGDLPAAGFAESAAALLEITRRFSAENGAELLQRWFAEVLRIDYHNSLRFRAKHKDDLLTFLRFKLPVLVPGSQPGDDLPAELAAYAEQSLARDGEVVVEKNDAVFRCRSPVCP
jgi:ubiquinone/menaquinone biosynthesis C-methylase UbiE